jgi:hypothetical protein
MQTFLPYKNFKKTAQALDYRRLGKQRVEAYQILNILLKRTKTKGWQKHPAVLMWQGYSNALKEYLNTCIDEWEYRGYKNNMAREKIKGKIIYPLWLGQKKFHSAHKSNLLRKDKAHYAKFKWKESDVLPYFWPLTKK